VRVIELWIPITATAALFQTWRTALQQRLRGQLSVNAAGFVRYVYALPVGLLFVALGYGLTGEPLPPPNARFLLSCAAAGFLQIVGTTLLIMAFGYRNFAVGTAYAKTEAVQGAIVAWIILGEALTPFSIVGILIGVAGVLVLSWGGKGLAPKDILAATIQPAALCGLGAGFVFAFTAIFIKDANRALPGDIVIIKALFGLLVTNLMQTAMQGSFLLWREPDQFRAAFTTWRSSAWVGALSACGSACWFSAFALAPVALVRALGQVEMVFTLLFSRFYLHEKLKRADIQGLVLVVAGVVLVLLGS
jgi:drug/metabolite transporter (DMT)-like permease